MALCNHRWVNVTTFDGFCLEQVCLNGCGETKPCESTPLDKLERSYDLEDFLKLRYGPATEVGLQKFLLSMPTDKRLKCRDRLYLDAGLRANLKAYTHLMRLCEQFYIPSSYANEAMRLLLRRKKGLHSQNMQAKALIHIIMESKERRLYNRVKLIEHEIVPRKNANPMLVVAR